VQPALQGLIVHHACRLLGQVLRHYGSHLVQLELNLLANCVREYALVASDVLERSLRLA
jgi:hypothetical protein